MHDEIGLLSNWTTMKTEVAHTSEGLVLDSHNFPPRRVNIMCWYGAQKHYIVLAEAPTGIHCKAGSVSWKRFYYFTHEVICSRCVSKHATKENRKDSTYNFILRIKPGIKVAFIIGRDLRHCEAPQTMSVTFLSVATSWVERRCKVRPNDWTGFFPSLKTRTDFGLWSH